MRRMATHISRFWPLLLALSCTACMPFWGNAYGTTSSGFLLEGEHLDRKGPNHRFYHGGDRRWGVPELCGMIERAAAVVAGEYDGATLLVGDMSARDGGFIGGHRSHRNGRDVDFAFYVTSERGRPKSGHPLAMFDRFGIGVRDGKAIRFDAARNWALVEAMLTDPEADVQWIFVSLGLKALLLEWALDNDKDIDIIIRAATVLHQPGDALPHDDHFHVRIYCPRNSKDHYCQDIGPVWPWVKAG